MPMATAAKNFGVCTTFFKKVCRLHGIKRWPYRKLHSLQKKMVHLQQSESDNVFSNKMNGLHQHIEQEFRLMQPQRGADRQVQSEPEEEGSQSEVSTLDTMEVETIESSAATGSIELERADEERRVEEQVCLVLAGLRNGLPPAPLVHTQWMDEKAVEAAPATWATSAPRSVSPSLRGSMSSGDTVPCHSPVDYSRPGVECAESMEPIMC